MVATADSLHYMNTITSSRRSQIACYIWSLSCIGGSRGFHWAYQKHNSERAAISHQPTTNHGRRTDSPLTTLHRLHHGVSISILARHPLRLQGPQLCTGSNNIILLLWFVPSTDLRLIATACLSTRSAQQNGYSKFQIWFNYGSFDCIWRMNSCSYFHQMNCKQQYWMMNKVLVLAKEMINWQHNAWQQQHNNQSGVSWLCL